MKKTTEGTRVLAKSLHTVTAIANVARYMALREAALGLSAEEAVGFACSALGLDGQSDEYGLVLAAIRQVAKGGK